MPLSLKRALRVTAAIGATWLFYLAFFRLLVSLDSVSFDSYFGEASTLACFFLVLLLPPPVWVYLRHRRRSVWIQEEAERWLAESRANPEKARKIKRRRKLLRKMFWIPSALALSIFLFLPESMGLVSHLFYASDVVLNGRRVRPPLTSFLIGDKKSYVAAWIGHGIARAGFSPYWHFNPPFSVMSFAAVRDRSEQEPLLLIANETASFDTTLELDDEVIFCWRISRQHENSPTGFVRLECRSSKNDFLSGFYGSREDANVFYKTLERAAHIKSR